MDPKTNSLKTKFFIRSIILILLATSVSALSFETFLEKFTGAVTSPSHLSSLVADNILAKKQISNPQFPMSKEIPSAIQRDFSCIESDGGLNLNTRGSFVAEDGYLIQDTCAPSNLLYETFCLEGCNCHQFMIRCRSGSHCQDGVCQFDANVTDTDAIYDHEYIPEIFALGEYQSVQDTCFSENEVIEDAGIFQGPIKCPEGMFCSGGKCVGDPISCQSLLPNWNSLEENRFNIVFVGTDYHLLYPNHDLAVNKFKNDVLNALGFNNNSYLGLFQIEPFKSRQNLFNFWYANRFAESDPTAIPDDTDPTPEQLESESSRRTKAARSQRGVSSICNVPNRIIISLDAVAGWNTAGDNLINFATYRDGIIKSEVSACVTELTDSCFSTLASSLDLSSNPYLDINGDNCYSFEDLKNNIYPSANQCISQATYRKVCPFTFQEARSVCEINKLIGKGLAHELAHTFGFADESAPYEGDLVPPLDITALDDVQSANCFIAESEEECRQKSPWKNMLGNGCGQQGIEDCYGIPAGKVEVTCFPGCLGGVRSYRSIPGSIMPYGTASATVSEIYGPSYKPISFGEWGDFIITQYMNAQLGIAQPTSNVATATLIPQENESTPEIVQTGESSTASTTPPSPPLFSSKEPSKVDVTYEHYSGEDDFGVRKPKNLESQKASEEQTKNIFQRKRISLLGRLRSIIR